MTPDSVQLLVDCIELRKRNGEELENRVLFTEALALIHLNQLNRASSSLEALSDSEMVGSYLLFVEMLKRITDSTIREAERQNDPLEQHSQIVLRLTTDLTLNLDSIEQEGYFERYMHPKSALLKTTVVDTVVYNDSIIITEKRVN